MRVALSGPGTADDDAVPSRRALEVEHVEVLGGEAGGTDAALDHDHVAHGGGGVRRAGARTLARRVDFAPNAASDVEAMHVGGGAGETWEDGRRDGVGRVRWETETGRDPKSGGEEGGDGSAGWGRTDAARAAVRAVALERGGTSEDDQTLPVPLGGDASERVSASRPRIVASRVAVELGATQPRPGSHRAFHKRPAIVRSACASSAAGRRETRI